MRTIPYTQCSVDRSAQGSFRRIQIRFQFIYGAYTGKVQRSSYEDLYERFDTEQYNHDYAYSTYIESARYASSTEKENEAQTRTHPACPFCSARRQWYHFLCKKNGTPYKSCWNTTRVELDTRQVCTILPSCHGQLLNHY